MHAVLPAHTILTARLTMASIGMYNGELACPRWAAGSV
jgi:hypothetical protein